MNLETTLKSIKPNMQIVDYNFYIFLAIVIVLIIFLIYFIYKKFFNKKENEFLIKLKNLDFNNSKKTAYEFTYLAKQFINEENKKLYEEIVKELNNYKYKKVVDNLNPELIKKIKTFIKDIK